MCAASRFRDGTGLCCETQRVVGSAGHNNLHRKRRAWRALCAGAVAMCKHRHIVNWADHQDHFALTRIVGASTNSTVPSERSLEHATSSLTEHNILDAGAHSTTQSSTAAQCHTSAVSMASPSAACACSCSVPFIRSPLPLRSGRTAYIRSRLGSTSTNWRER
jgi:hypothetical protein